MYTVSVTVAASGEPSNDELGGGGLHVHLESVTAGAAYLPAGADEGTAGPDEGPSPIAPEPKELLWGLGAFLVFLVLMRLVLFPKVKQGMIARYSKIHEGHERADSLREDAKREVAEYEQALATVREDVASRIEVASRQLESERAERLATATTAIAERRAAAAAEYEVAKSAARDSIEAAVVDVAGRTVELSIGRRPDDAAVRRAAGEVIGVGVGS